MTTYQKWEQDVISSLSAAIKSSSKDAFEVLFKAEFENIRFFIFHYTGDQEVAADLSQDTFLTLWDTRQRIDPKHNLRSYLYTIARNKALNHLSMLRTRMTDSIERSGLDNMISALTDDSLVSIIDSLDMKRIIDVTYCELPDLVRKIFVLSREEGLSYDEIARKLEIPVKKVEFNISKALKIFRKKLIFFQQ